MTILSGLSLRAQDIPNAGNFRILQNEAFYPNNRVSEVRLTGNSEIGSNVFNSELMLFRINDNVIDNNFKRTSIYSRAGAVVNSGIRFTGYDVTVNDSGLFIWGGISTSYNIGMGVTEPLLKMAMRGNAQYAGEKIDLSGSSITFMSYDRLTLGLGSDHGELRWKAGVSYISGRDLANLYIRNGLIDIGADGDSINGQMNANWNYSNMGNLYNGSGFGIDFELQGKLGPDLLFTVAANDIGAVWWSNTRQSNVDSDIAYDGFTYSLNRSERSGLDFVDSLSNDYVTSDTASYRTGLPFRFKVQLTNQITPRHHLSLEAYYVNISGYSPSITVRHHWFMSKVFALESSIGYGGFGNLRWCENACFQFGDHWGASAGIMGIEGLVSNNIALNGGLNAQVGYFF